jgi:hypothetical protein
MQAIVKEKYKIVRSSREENVQYLNYLLKKKTWELGLRETSAHEAYNECLSIFQYYYDIAMPKKRVKIMQPKINVLPQVQGYQVSSSGSLID